MLLLYFGSQKTERILLSLPETIFGEEPDAGVAMKKPLSKLLSLAQVSAVLPTSPWLISRPFTS